MLGKTHTSSFGHSGFALRLPLSGPLIHFRKRKKATMTSIKYVWKVVREFEKDKKIIRRHVDHLRHLVFILHNELSGWLKHPGKSIDVLNVIISKSDMIKQTTLMGMKMKDKINSEKNYLLAQLEEECGYKVPCRHKTMEVFYKGNNHTNFDNKVTESAVELVSAACRIWAEAQIDEETVDGIDKLCDMGRFDRKEHI